MPRVRQRQTAASKRRLRQEHIHLGRVDRHCTQPERPRREMYVYKKRAHLIKNRNRIESNMITLLKRYATASTRYTACQ